MQKPVKYYSRNLPSNTSGKELASHVTFDQQNRTAMVHLSLIAVAIFFSLFFYYAAMLNRDHSIEVQDAVPAH